MVKKIIRGMAPGKRAQGRPKMAWNDNVMSWTGLLIDWLLRKTGTRSGWNQTVRGWPVEDGCKKDKKGCFENTIVKAAPRRDKTIQDKTVQYMTKQ